MDINQINNPNVNKEEIRDYQKSYLKILLLVLGVVILGSIVWLYLLIKFL